MSFSLIHSPFVGLTSILARLRARTTVPLCIFAFFSALSISLLSFSVVVIVPVHSLSPALFHTSCRFSGTLVSMSVFFVLQWCLHSPLTRSDGGFLYQLISYNAVSAHHKDVLYTPNQFYRPVSFACQVGRIFKGIWNLQWTINEAFLPRADYKLLSYVLEKSFLPWCSVQFLTSSGLHYDHSGPYQFF